MCMEEVFAVGILVERSFVRSAGRCVRAKSIQAARRGGRSKINNRRSHVQARVKDKEKTLLMTDEGNCVGQGAQCCFILRVCGQINAKRIHQQPCVCVRDINQPDLSLVYTFWPRPVGQQHSLTHTLMAKYPPFTTSRARSTSPYKQLRTVSTTCHRSPLEGEAIMKPPSPRLLLLLLLRSCWVVAAPGGGDVQQYGLEVIRVARLKRGVEKLDIIAILDRTCAGRVVLALQLLPFLRLFLWAGPGTEPFHPPVRS